MDYFLYLSSCTTCKRIIGELALPKEVVLIDIKKDPLTADQLAYLHQSTGSYLDLINKRAQLFKNRKIDPQKLTEEAAKDLLLEHYTFLKRPVLVYQNKIFVGNSKAVVADAKKRVDEH
jgi:arsenate reductase (glutaredoxin)